MKVNESPAVETEMSAPLSGSLKDWLQFGRLQTAALTAGALVLAWLMAGGAADWRVVAWWVFGVALHWIGFAQNGLLDLKHDRGDPQKAHHPLVAGRIGHLGAWSVWVTVTMMVMVAGTVALPPGAALALWGFYWFGTAYNLLSKRVLGADVAAGAAYAMVPWIAGLTTGHPTPALHLYLLSAAIFLAVVFQNAIEGSLKDMVGDHRNPLQALGWRVVDLSPLRSGMTLLVSMRGAALAWGLRGAGVWVLWKMCEGGYLVGKVVFVALAVAVWGLTYGFLFPGPYQHDRRLKQIALSEVLLWVALVLAVHLAAPGRVGWAQVAVLVVVPIVWFTAFNKALWGQFSAPKV